MSHPWVKPRTSSGQADQARRCTRSVWKSLRMLHWRLDYEILSTESHWMFFSGHSFCPKLSPFIFPPSSFPFAAVHHKRTATIGNKRLLCKDNGNKRFSISMNGKERVAQPLVHVDLLQTKGFWEKWKRTSGFLPFFSTP